MTPIERLNRANELAPIPATRDAGVEQWVRHYAAQALAAWAAFHDLTTGPVREEDGPTIGLLATLGTAASAAAAALVLPGPRLQWDLTPEAGALNGEWEEWLTDSLDGNGVNPADLDDRYNAADFRSPSVQAAGRG